MECVRETTASFKESVLHTYLLDGTKMVAYVPQGSVVPFYFKKPIEFSRRGRTFVAGNKKLFPKKPVTNLIKVAGSKLGTYYYVDPEKHTCTCPGFTFRGKCKHTNDYK